MCMYCILQVGYEIINLPFNTISDSIGKENCPEAGPPTIHVSNFLEDKLILI